MPLSTDNVLFEQTKHYLLKVALNTINKQTKHYLLKVALNTIKQTNKTLSVESGVKHRCLTPLSTDNALFVCLMVFNATFNR
jgi:hypothetical protein